MIVTPCCAGSDGAPSRRPGQFSLRRPIPDDPRNATGAISATFPLVKDGSNKWFTPYAWWSIDDATGRIAFRAISGPAPSGKEVNSPAGCTEVTAEGTRKSSPAQVPQVVIDSLGHARYHRDPGNQCRCALLFDTLWMLNYEQEHLRSSTDHSRTGA